MPQMDRKGHIVLSCLSVCLLSTQTFAITFELQEEKTSRLAYKCTCSANDDLSDDTKVSDLDLELYHMLKIAFFTSLQSGVQFFTNIGIFHLVCIDDH